ncbi:MAG: hypothetical protein VKL59_22000 [Nostocaceae cyanobacterium]|nr:hypothetical protein [Nostocaceae cyanobacterium]
MHNKPIPTSISSIKLTIAQERLRQARVSFNTALAATTVSFLISLVGAGLLLSDKVPEGSVVAAGGLVSSVGFLQLAKDANDRLGNIPSELDDE